MPIPFELTEHEEQILREVAGELPVSPWGAWVGACLGILRGGGFLDRSNQLTQKGRDWLAVHPRQENLDGQ